MVLRVSLLGELSITGDLDPGTGALQARAEIERQPAGPGRDARELAVPEALAASLNARHGHSSAKLQLTLERSVALASGRTTGRATRPGSTWTSG